MSIALVVVHPFGVHAKGARITDPNEVQAVLESNPNAVVKTAVDEQADPPASPAASAEESHQ